jgi:hypothetical protein
LSTTTKHRATAPTHLKFKLQTSAAFAARPRGAHTAVVAGRGRAELTHFFVTFVTRRRQLGLGVDSQLVKILSPRQTSIGGGVALAAWFFRYDAATVAFHTRELAQTLVAQALGAAVRLLAAVETH